MTSINGALSPLLLYVLDSGNEAKKVAIFQASDPQTKSDIAHFQKVAATLSTPDLLLKDRRSLAVVLNAFGLSGSINSTALLKKLMTQDPTASGALASRLGDAKLQRFANAMNGFKPPPFSNAGDITATIQAAATNGYESQQDRLAPGLQQALYFKRNIANVTTVNALMSDATLLKVAVIGAGQDINQFGNLDFAQQQTIVKQSINLKQFQNPKQVDKLVENFLIRQNQSTAAISSASVGLSIISGAADGSGQSLLGAIYGQSGSSTTDILSSLYPSTSSSSGDPLLQLFA